MERTKGDRRQNIDTSTQHDQKQAELRLVMSKAQLVKDLPSYSGLDLQYTLLRGP